MKKLAIFFCHKNFIFNMTFYLTYRINGIKGQFVMPIDYADDVKYVCSQIKKEFGIIPDLTAKIYGSELQSTNILSKIVRSQDVVTFYVKKIDEKSPDFRLYRQPIIAPRYTNETTFIVFSTISFESMTLGDKIKIDINNDTINTIKDNIKNMIKNKYKDICNSKSIDQSKILLYLPGGVPFISGNINSFIQSFPDYMPHLYAIVIRNTKITDEMLSKNFNTVCNISTTEMTTLLSPNFESKIDGLCQIASVLGYIQQSSKNVKRMIYSIAKYCPFAPLINGLYSLSSMSSATGQIIIQITLPLSLLFQEMGSNFKDQSNIFRHTVEFLTFFMNVKISNRIPCTEFIRPFYSIGYEKYFHDNFPEKDFPNIESFIAFDPDFRSMDWVRFNLPSLNDKDFKNAMELTKTLQIIPPMSLRVTHRVCLFHGKNGPWLYLAASVSKEETEKDKIDYINPEVGHIEHDTYENIAIKTIGVDSESKSFEHEALKSVDSDKVKQIVFIVIDKSGSMSSGFSDGLNRFQASQKFFVKFTNTCYRFHTTSLYGSIMFDHRCEIRNELNPLVNDFQKKMILPNEGLYGGTRMATAMQTAANKIMEACQGPANRILEVCRASLDKIIEAREEAAKNNMEACKAAANKIMELFQEVTNKSIDPPPQMMESCQRAVNEITQACQAAANKNMGNCQGPSKKIVDACQAVINQLLKLCQETTSKDVDFLRSLANELMRIGNSSSYTKNATYNSYVEKLKRVLQGPAKIEPLQAVYNEIMQSCQASPEREKETDRGPLNMTYEYCQISLNKNMATLQAAAYQMMKMCQETAYQIVEACPGANVNKEDFLINKYPKAVRRIMVISDGEDACPNVETAAVSNFLLQFEIRVDAIIVSSEIAKGLVAISRYTGGIAIFPRNLKTGINLFNQEGFFNVDIRQFGEFHKGTLTQEVFGKLPKYTENDLDKEIKIKPFEYADENRLVTSPSYAISEFSKELQLGKVAQSARPNQKRIIRELMKIVNEPDGDIRVFPLKDRVDVWRVLIKGFGKFYEKKWFFLIIEFTPEYPQHYPFFRFIKPPFHPNITDHGRICLDTLDQNYRSDKSVRDLIGEIRLLLYEPNFDSPVDLKRENLKSRMNEFEQTVNEWNNMNGKDTPEEWEKDWKIQPDGQIDAQNLSIADVPEGFICPITRKIMKEPVKAQPTQIYYEREALRKYLKEEKPFCKSKIDPNGKPILLDKNQKLTVDSVMQTNINKWKKENNYHENDDEDEDDEMPEEANVEYFLKEKKDVIIEPEYLNNIKNP